MPAPNSPNLISHANVLRVTEPDDIQDPAILRILRSDLPEEKKLAVIARLIEERKRAQPQLDALKLELLAALKDGAASGTIEELADRLVVEAEEHLRDNG